jgi:hypothetical protein
MELINVKVQLEDRIVEIISSKGNVATFESGIVTDSIEYPKDKIVIFTNNKGLTNEPAAWVQVFKYDDNHNINLVKEGWINGIEESLINIGSIEILNEKNGTDYECMKDVKFGLLGCCTSYGNGGRCYVRCCGGCCSDPYGCPGASCCG